MIGHLRSMRPVAGAACMLLATVGVVANVSGCRRPAATPSAGMPRQGTVPVAGTVRHRGQPVPNATLAMQSADGVILARGRTDAAGAFGAVSTYGTDDGVPPGRYRVMVAVSGTQEIEPGVLAPEPPGGFVSPIPRKYASLDTTDIEVEIAAGGATDLVIDVP